ncbi:malonic semialdehyde reductase [Patulibacter sp. SYSU D01012]|uniref:malonic semialdehyde reductase n=1 Tax=Patulibacter sp. SYSU D01012 TaxID=2817381 RepID=UPI001B30E60D|nr:malonic semialdehyde reductase [Patulibacter sp. SYSU D01012]
MSTTDTDVYALAPEARALLFTEARTANAFADEPVTDEQLRAIVDLAKWPPTAANTNPLRILFVRTPEGRARLLPHLAEGNRAKTASAPVTAVLAFDSEFYEHMPRLFPPRASMREALAASPTSDDMARYNAALQTAYFLLAVRAVGLAAGPMAGFDAAGVDEEFFAGTSWRSHLVVNVGRPGADAWLDRLPRFDYEDIVREV